MTRASFKRLWKKRGKGDIDGGGKLYPRVFPLRGGGAGGGPIPRTGGQEGVTSKHYEDRLHIGPSECWKEN